MNDKTARIIHWAKNVDYTIALTGIENKASWIRDDAVDLARYVRMIPNLPEYETRAEDMVDLAELALTEALLSVKLTKSELSKKRTEVQAGE